MVQPPRARYQQVADALRERIRGRNPGYRPADRLPGGPDIAAEFGVHLVTAQRAVAVLNTEGLTKPDAHGRPVVQAWRRWAVTLTPADGEPLSREVEAPDQLQALARVLAQAGPGYASAQATVKPAEET